MSPRETYLLNRKTLCYHPDRSCSRVELAHRGRKSPPLIEVAWPDLPPGAWPCSYCYSAAGMRRQRGY